MNEENIVKKEKNSPAPDYLKLIEMLHQLGYEIISFKNKSNFDEKYTFTIFRSRS